MASMGAVLVRDPFAGDSLSWLDLGAGLTGITGDAIFQRMEIVQDTNLFVAALRSHARASAEVLDRCLALDDQAVIARHYLQSMRK
jgi:hypothetical protein